MRYLFALQLPPPVHGSSVVGKMVLDLFVKRSDMKSSFVDIGISKKSDDIGNFRIFKIWRFGFVICNLLGRLVIFRPDRVYYAPTLSRYGFLKDFISVLLIKLFLKRSGSIYFHLHNRGISELGEIKGIQRRMYAYFFNSVKVILLSNHLFDDVKSFVDRDQVFVLANGTKDMPLAKRSYSTRSSRTLQIGYLSNLIISKGVLILLNVLQELDKRGRKFNCTIAGIESELTAISLNVEIEKRGLNGKVNYVGAVQGESKVHFFKELDVFVFPTKYPLECMPLVLIEAISSGLPIISSRLGGIPDVVDDSNGFLVEVDELEKGVYNALCQLYETPELIERLGINSRKIFEEKFTEEIFNKNIFDILTV